MISVMKEVLDSPSLCQDKLTYFQSLAINLSMSPTTDKDKEFEFKRTLKSVVESIGNQISSPKTRLQGMQLLEIALQQNTEPVLCKGKWIFFVYKSIRDSKVSSTEKIQACKLLALTIPHMSTSHSSFETAIDELINIIFPFLLKKIDENVEWAQEAGICVKKCLQNFSREVAIYQFDLFNTLLNQASLCMSSKSFEVFAECFSEIPNCAKEHNVDFKDRWSNIYLQTLKTVESLLVASLNNELYSLAGIPAKEFTFKEDKDGSSGSFSDYVKNVRRFGNLCRCLAKLISVERSYPVKVPVYLTLKIILQLFSVCKNEMSINPEQETMYTFIAQIKLSGFPILESLLLNCNLSNHTVLMREIIKAAIDSSYSFSHVTIREIRIATWAILSLWVDVYGALVFKEIFDSETSNIHTGNKVIEELLKDISCRQEIKAKHENNKSKTDISSNNLLHVERLCSAALDCLDSILCIGLTKLSKERLQPICHEVFNICEIIGYRKDSIPFPYSNESCREKLYSVVLTIIDSLKPYDHRIFQSALRVLHYMKNDSSYKVRKISNRALARCKLQLYPNRQLSVFIDTKKRQENSSDKNLNSVWSSAEYVSDIKIQSMHETTENIKIETSFTTENEIETHSEDYMEMETNYSEQVVENQCNGEEIEIQSSSQCQDDVDSEDDDDDDDEEEEEEERSFADEEINQETCIPITRKMPTSSSIQISTEIIQSTSDPDYEELDSCIKAEEITTNSSNKDKCMNGEKNVGNEENMPSSTTQKTNENGIFGIDDDNVDEENEEEEEEENCESYVAEKRMENYEQPPSKKQKIEIKDVSEADERNNKARSPTLEEMKADLIIGLPSEEDVKSGKIKLSSP